MQGIVEFIPTDRKIEYINRLLKVGFDTIDFGSFVSPRAVPQMRDTARVLEGLDLDSTSSRLLSIVGNLRGARDATGFEAVDFLGFPFSVSEEFQRRNLNSSIEDSFSRVAAIQELCLKHDKRLVVYISMGFGNPYGEDWSPEIVAEWTNRLANLGVGILALSDTIGVADPKSIGWLFDQLVPAFPQVEFGAHFHTTPDTWLEKIDAAWKHGCKRFDGALRGFGGCPMAKDDLTGNMATENIVQYLESIQVEHSLDKPALREAMRLAVQILPGAEQLDGEITV
jgi:hydroxymethylglutaryl-CoA lyase